MLLGEKRIRDRAVAIEAEEGQKRGIQVLKGIASGVTKRRKMVVTRNEEGEETERVETTEEPAFADRIRAVMELSKRGHWDGRIAPEEEVSATDAAGLTGLE